MSDVLICDTECYGLFWLVAFKRVRDGKIVSFELSDRSVLNVDRVRDIIMQNRIITYNGLGYDMPMIWLAIGGATNARLKRASDQIIQGGVKYWEVEDILDVRIPRSDHIDLMEPQPNAFAGLKTLNGRLHGKKMQDLPIEPDAVLTHADMDLLTKYCFNDLDATHLLYDALAEPLALRDYLSEEYSVNFRSKSDAQIGEGIIKKRIEEATRQKVQRVEVPAGTVFQYPVPDYMAFDTPELIEIVERLRTTEFIVKHDGKVDLPLFLANKKITIGQTTYAMGIGGLHSTEAARTVVPPPGSFLRDFDVAAFYPSIILGSGLYPKAVGKEFLAVYRKIRDDRIAAKARVKEIDEGLKSLFGRRGVEVELSILNQERRENVSKDQGLKISINGIYGKLGSPYSILYAPHLMIAVTLTGQLALLMLIDRAERAGIQVVSANTDGVVFLCRDDQSELLVEVTSQWQRDTDFVLETTDYASLHSASVNTYIAIKPDGKVKRKGTLANPRKEGDTRTQLMKNPCMSVCSDAVVALLTHGTPLADTIRACTDIRDFVTVVNVKGGGTWRGEYLGKVVRYIWSTDGAEILYKTAHATTGNYKKVSKSDGCRPVMDLPDELPSDIDYARYIAEANEILQDIGAVERAPPPGKPIRIFKKTAWAWFALVA